MEEPALNTFDLGGIEAAVINDLLEQLMIAWRRSRDPYAVVDRARELKGFLPRRLRDVLNRFADRRASSVMVVRGVPLEPLGATPGHWSRAEDDRSSLLLVLIGEAVGMSFGWSTQQAGRLVHDVVPTIGDEHIQIGSNSTEAVTLHTEDAFHPFRGEWLALLCLRNPNRVATLVSIIDSVELPPEEWAALREPAYPLLTDLSHHPDKYRYPKDGQSLAIPAAEAAFLPTLGWDDQRSVESLRFDPYFTGQPRTARHAAALEALALQFERNHIAVELQPGDLLLIDNHRAVHGRAAFEASYQDDERWLKRICITGDLARSRSHRHSATCRVVGCDGGVCATMLDLRYAADHAI
jgi:Fe(II)/alpha-ketoglutarate-dependent arginine beta-hydroxylase